MLIDLFLGMILIPLLPLLLVQKPFAKTEKLGGGMNEPEYCNITAIILCDAMREM